MTQSFPITATRTLRQRKDGEVAFFDGALDGARIRIQTKIGDALRATIEGDRLVALTDEAGRMIADMIAAADARAVAYADRVQRLHAESGAKVDEIMALVLADARAEGMSDEEIAAEAGYVLKLRSVVLALVDDHVRTGQPWGDTRKLLERARYQAGYGR